MKIILKQDVKKLGYKDDVLNVKNGYANNFLIPRSIAVVATDSNLKQLAEDIKQAEFKKEKLKNFAIETVDKLQDLKITIGAKAGTNGKIFGSVTPLQISQALKTLGYEVDRRKIVLEHEIKMIGTFEASVNLFKDVSAKISIDVIAE